MAEAARKLGGDVTVIHGPVHISPPAGVHAVEITSTAQLFEQVKNHADAEVIIMAAAVSDFTPDRHSGQKIKKEEGMSSLNLRRTPDILAWLGSHKKNGQTLVGFAMETENMVEYAREKRKRKKADWIIANSITGEESGFETDTNTVTLLGDNIQQTFSGSKKDVAGKVLDRIFGT